MLPKHKETDIRKRNELQNEAVRVWDEARFQNDGGRNSPAAFAALQMPDNFLPTIFLSRLHLFLRLVTCTKTKVFFLFVTSKSSAPGLVVEAGIIANCLGKFLVENSILRRHFWAVLT